MFWSINEEVQESLMNLTSIRRIILERYAVSRCIDAPYWEALASTKAGLIIKLGLAKVDARLVSGVFSGDLTVKVEAVMGGSSPTFGSGKGVSVEKPDGGVSSLPLVKLEKLKQGSAHKLVIVGVSRDLREIPGFSVPRSLPWRESLGREENVGFDLVRCYLCPSFSEGSTTRVVGLRVANSYTGNHREDDFTPLETIRRFLGAIKSRSLSSLEGRPSSRIGGYVISGHECVMPTHEYIRKIIKDANENDHFTRDPRLSGVEYLNAEGGIASGYFGDMKTFCKNIKLEKVVAVIKSCTPNALGELIVTLKDPFGIMVQFL
ncbi:hypothetical protein Tco_0870569 [Tanacetum coccineum]